jgi:hypothetical protein
LPTPMGAKFGSIGWLVLTFPSLDACRKATRSACGGHYPGTVGQLRFQRKGPDSEVPLDHGEFWPGSTTTVRECPSTL